MPTVPPELKASKPDWPALLFILVAVPLAFTFGGLWVGVPVLVIGLIMLGWSRRHDGPLPTNGRKATKE